MATPRNRFVGQAVVASSLLLTAAAIAVALAGVGPRFTQVAGRDSLSIPGASLEKGSIRFFSYSDDVGKRIRFILGRDQSGKVQGAFDACQQCAQYRKGYTSSRGYLVCRFCGNHYRLDSSAGVGSCAPVKLMVHDTGSAVRVDTRQLKEQEALF